MKILVNGRNIQLTEAIKAHVTEKFSRLEHSYDFLLEIHVFLGVEKNPRIQNNHTAEATVHVRGAILRMESASTDLYASIDVLLDKVDRGLGKHKTKLLHRTKAGHGAHGESIRKQYTEDGVNPPLKPDTADDIDDTELELITVYETVVDEDEEALKSASS